MWLYTNKSGIKTIVWTDTLQTTFLILGAVISFYTIVESFDITFSETVDQISKHEYFSVFNWESSSGNNFFKQFIAGILVAIAMIGLDQNMMQKTLTCKNQWDAQKNGITLATNDAGQLINTDALFPNLALNHLGVISGICFLLGIIAASFSSVDSSLTALTTSFTYDFLDISHKSSVEKKKLKNWVLLGFSILVFTIIMLFSNSKGDVISLIFKVAGYTYGPLLGLYMFGMFTNISIKDKWVPIICFLAPITTYVLSEYSTRVLSFDFGFVNIAVNAGLTVLGLLLLKNKK